MRFKSLNGLLSILFVSLVMLSLIVSFVGAKPVGKNPGTSWPGGTFWGTNLRLENDTFVGQAWFGTRATELKIGSPPDPPDGLIVEFFDNSVRYGTWVKVPAANENWPVRLRNAGAAPSSGTLSSVMENADTLFVPQDFSVVLENTAQSFRANLRKENKFIASLPLLATLYVDNAVNIESIDNLDPLTGDAGDNLRLRVFVTNTGRYTDNYAVSAGGSLDPTILNLAPGNTDNVIVTTILPTGTENVVITAAGNYATDQDYVTATGSLVRRVEVSISPSLQTGWTGDNLVYTFTVKNTGNLSDSYNLNLTEILGWPHSVLGTTDNTFKDFMDTYIRENTPATSYWGRYNMYAGKENNGGVIQSENAYAKWNLADAHIPAGVAITNAYVWVVGTYGPSHNPGNIADNTWLEAWSVTDDTWNGLGDNITWSSGGPAMVSLLDNIHWIASAWIGQQHWWSFNVTSFVQSEYTGDNIVSIGWTSNGIGDNGIYGGNNGWWNTRDNHTEGTPAPYPDHYFRSPWMQVNYDTGTIAPGENLTGQIWVVVAGSPGDIDNLTVTATSTGDNTVSDNATCQAKHAVGGVDVTINPPSKSGTGDTTFTVTVMNTGDLPDNYGLFASDTEGWTLSLDNAVLGPMPVGENRSTTLHVNILNLPGTIDNVTVTAVSWHSGVSDNATCQAMSAAVELYDKNDNFVNFFPTIQSAIDNALPGYKVLVRPGTYTENLLVNKENLRILSSDGAGVTIIDAGGVNVGVMIAANGVTFQGFTVNNDNTGIYLLYSSNSLISNNILGNSKIYSTLLLYSDNNRVENNIVENNIGSGIELQWSDNNLVENNTAENNSINGIYLYYSTNNRVLNNNCLNNHMGIRLWQSSNNIISYNTSSNTLYGIDLEYSGNNIVENNTSENNGQYGILLYSSNINNLDNNTVKNNNADGIYLENSNNNTLDNNTCENNYYGIYLDNSNNNILIYNTLTGNQYGFYVWYSNNNQIDNNIILNTGFSNYGSCPYLYTWDGAEMKLLGDINGPGALGYRIDMSRYGGGIELRPPTRIDYAAIEGLDLVPKDGSYTLEVAEDSNEITYIDNAQLWVIDHDPGVEIYSPEAAIGTTSPYLYPPVIHTVRNPTQPVSATDWNGNDVLPVIASPDGVFTAAEPLTDSFITLDLGNLSGAPQIKLIYRAYADWSVERSKIKSMEYVEVKNASGEWEMVSENEHFGKPEGEPRTFVIDITNWFKTNDWHLRIHTGTYKIHVDWIAVDTSVDEPVTVTVLKPTSANLYYKGPDHPGFDYFFGNFTKYGDVLPLLQKADDEFVIMRSGDSVELKFAAQPAPVGGRDFMLVTDAYFKQPFVKYLLGSKISTVDPLPFHEMSNYPYPSSESYPSDAEHLAYLSEWNTREYGEGGAGMSLPYSDNNTVFGNKIIGSYYGLYLDTETNTRILNNTISNTDDGIYLYHSVNCIIDNNIVENNSNSGIYFDSSENDNLTNNTCENNVYGIYVYGDIYGNNRVRMIGNTIENNSSDGIYFDGDIYGNSLVQIENNSISNNGSAIPFLTGINSNSIINAAPYPFSGIYFSSDIYDDSTVSVIGNILDNNYGFGIGFGIIISGADFYGDSTVRIDNNSISNNLFVGIYFGGDIYEDSYVGVAGNTIDQNGDAGIYFSGEIFENSFTWIDSNSISNNGLLGSSGIEFNADIYENVIVLVTRNTIDSNGHGIFVNADVDAPLIIFANHITNNVVFDSGVHVESDVDSIGVIIGFNNILGNIPYGVFNDGLDVLHAPYNFWGDASGPGGAGPGTGIVDNISEGVIFRPWIPSPFEQVFMGFNFAGYASEGHNTLNPTMYDLNFGVIPETAAVSFDGKHFGGIVITMFRAIGGAPIPAGLKSAFFMDISTIPENNAENFQITVHYTDGDVSGIDESSLKLYYWSSADNLWHLCNNISVNTSTNMISGTLNHLTPFGIFGVPGVAVPPAGVEISISPSARSGPPGSKLSYTITVTNTGSATDTFALSVHGGTGWSPKLSTNSLTLAAGESGDATLEVTVPVWAATGQSTTITVTATSMADLNVSASTSCRAIVSAPTPGPVSTTPTGMSWILVLVMAGSILAIILLLIIILYFKK